MQIKYKNESVKKLCATEKAAKKFFNDMKYYKHLKATINYIEQAVTLSDVAAFQPFHFHSTDFYIENSFGLDIAGRKSKYRLIVIPIDDSWNIVINDDLFFRKCKEVHILKIEEVSNHYEQ